MAAVISGEGLGLYGSSLNTLGSRGPAANSGLGRFGNQVYVNAYTGNLVVNERDEFIASLGLDLGFNRTYNSLGLMDGDNNDNWRLGVHRKLTNITAGTSITKIYGDGSEIVFNYDSGLGYYVSTQGDGAHDTITSAAGGNWVWQDGNSDVTETYDSTGQLLNIKDSDGNTKTFSYTGSLVTGISDSNGQTVILAYIGNNLQSITTSSNGVTQTRVLYGYDTRDRLVTVTVDLGANESFVTHYTYDSSNRIIAIDHTGGGAPADLSIAYDGNGRVQTLTDASGNITQYSYAANITTVTDPLLRQTAYHYDGQGRLTKVESPALTSGGARLVTEYAYDTSGNVTQVKDPTGAIVAFQYDSRGNLTKQTDAAGNVVEYSYTTDNLLASQTVYLVADPDYSGVGSVSNGSLQPADPKTTYYIYDTERHLRFVISPEGKVTEHRYDTAGNRSSTRVYANDAFSVAAASQYGEIIGFDLNNLIGVTGQDFPSSGQVEVLENGSTLRVTGNRWPGINLPYTVTADTILEFDFYSPVQGEVQGIGFSTDNSSISGSRTFKLYGTQTIAYVDDFTYAGDGNTMHVRIPVGQYFTGAMSYLHFINDDDAAPHDSVSVFSNVRVYEGLKESQLAAWAGNAARDLSAIELTEYTYDILRGQLASTTRYSATDENGVGQSAGASTTDFIYDQRGQLLESISHRGLESFETVYVYDGLGRLIAQTDALGNVTTIDYDDANNRVSTQFANDLVTTDVYDNNGRLISSSDYAPAQVSPLSVDYRLYDAAGQLRVSIDPVGANTYYFYDGAGRQTGIIDPKGLLTEFIYDGAGRLERELKYATPVSQSILDQLAVDPSVLLQIAALSQAPTTVTATGEFDAVAGNASNTQTAVFSDGSSSNNVDLTVGSAYTSLNLRDYALVRSGDSLVQTAGVSLAADTALFNDATPTEVKATIYRSDGTVYDTVYVQVGVTETPQILLNTRTPVQPYSHQATATTDTVSQASQNVTITVDSTGIPFTQTSNVQNFGYTYNSSTQTIQSNGSGFSLGTNSADHNDDTPTSVQAKVYTSGGTLVQTVTLVPGHVTQHSFNDGYGGTLNYKVWHGATNWNGHLNLGSLSPGNYYVDITTKDDAIASTMGTNSSPGSDGDSTWTRTNTEYFTIGGGVDHIDTRLTWPQSVEPAGTASVSFRYKPTGSGTWTALTVGTVSSNHYVDIDHAVNGTYDYEIIYRDTYNNVLKSTDTTTPPTFTVNGSTDSTPSAAFIYDTYSSSATSGASAAAFPMTTSEAQLLSRIEAKLFLPGTSTQVGTTAVTWPDAHANYFAVSGEYYVNLRTGSAIPDGQYDVQITKFFKNNTSDVDTYYLEVGLQPEPTNQNYFWNGVDNWDGEVNLKLGPGLMPVDTYEVVIAVRDDAANYGSFNGTQIGTTGAPGADGDGTWQTTNTVFVTTAPYTTLEWSSASQPADTIVEFSYRPDGTSTYIAVPVTEDNGTYRVKIDRLAAGEYDYRIRYLNNNDAIDEVLPGVTLDDLRPEENAADRQTYNVHDEAGRLIYTFDAEGYVTQYKYNGAGDIIDTIEHATAFPGFVDNDANGIEVTTDGDSTLIEWIDTVLAAGIPEEAAISVSITDEETGNALQVELDLESNTGTVQQTRLPNQVFDYDSYATIDSRTVAGGSTQISIGNDDDFLTPNLQYDSTISYAYATPSAPISRMDNSTNDSGIIRNSITGMATLPSSTTLSNGGSGLNWYLLTYSDHMTMVMNGHNYMDHAHLYDSASGSIANGGTVQFSSSSLDTNANYVFVRNSARTDSATYSINVGIPEGTQITLPKNGAGSLEFSYRYTSGEGTTWTNTVAGVSSGSNFTVTLPYSHNGKVIEYRAVYSSSGNPVRVVSGSATVADLAASVVGSSNFPGWTGYELTTGTGAIYQTYLTPTEMQEDVASLGEETAGDIEWIDVEVYQDGTTTNPVSGTVRTRPNALLDLDAQYDRSITLTTSGDLANGLYDIKVLRKHYGSATPTESWIYDFRVGNHTVYNKTLSWSASVQAVDLSAGESATFFYRQQGQANFTELALTLTNQNPDHYFVRDGNTYEVRLHDLEPGATYEYYVEYRAANDLVLKSTHLDYEGQTNTYDTFATSGASNPNAAFQYFEVDSTPSAGQASGTRLVGYLPAEEFQSVDYIEVEVTGFTAGGVPVESTAITIPRAESNYRGELNLTTGTLLQAGRYDIQITKHYHDGDSDIIAIEDYEIGQQAVGSPINLNVVVDGDLVTASYTGAGLGLASGLTFTVDKESGRISLDAQALSEGNYSYSREIADAGDVLNTSEGRFAVFTGDVPEAAAVESYYSHDRIVGVDVIQGTHESTRSPALPNEYNYMSAANSLETVTTQASFVLIADSQTVSTGLTDGKLDISGARMPTVDNRWPLVSVTYIIKNSAGKVVYTGGVSVGNTQITIPAFIMASPGSYTLIVTNTCELQENMGYMEAGSQISASSSYSFTPNIRTSTSISWSANTQPAGTTARFLYRAAGENYRSANSLTVVNGMYIAAIDHEPEGEYKYIIEYSNQDGIVAESSGSFYLDLGNRDNGGVAPEYQQVMLEYSEQTGTQNGSALELREGVHADRGRTDVDHVVATVLNLATNQSYQTTTQLLDNAPLLSVNLTDEEDGVLPGGVYEVSLTLHLESGPQLVRGPFTVEVGPQPVQDPLTELRWDATDRPPNTEVYFRYKPEAQYEFSPENMWIRATASYSPNGKIYSVRFPQSTPDGLQQLEILPEGSYDYMIIYVDRDSGKEVESALGQFNVEYTDGGPDQTASHQLTFTRDLEARHTRSFQNDLGQKTAELDALGYLTEYLYDAAGRLAETIRYANATMPQLRNQGTLNQLRPAATIQDQHQYFYWDGQGRQVMAVDAEGYVTEMLYDQAGNLTQTTRYYNPTEVTDFSNAGINDIRPDIDAAKDQVTLSTYTALNQLASVSSMVSGSAFTTTSYLYDVMGRIVAITTAAGTSDERRVESQYDLQGSLIASLGAEGVAAYEQWLSANPGASQAEKDAAAYQILLEYGVRHEYDATGNRISSRDQNDNLTRYYYDARGQLTHVVNALGEVMENVYDAFGQVVQTIRYADRLLGTALSGLTGGLITPAVRAIFDGLRDLDRDSVTEQSYERRGLLTGLHDALGYETRYQYNAFGEQRFARQILRGGQHDGQQYEVEYIYDARGQRTNVINNTDGVQHSTGFDYDAFGRQVAAYTYDSSQNLHAHYYTRYDKLGRAIEQLEVRDIASSTTHTVNAYTYDAFSRVLSRTDGNDQTTDYLYGFDGDESFVQITTPEDIVAITRSNRHGEQVEVIDGNGKSTHFEYNRNGELVSILDAENNETVHEYDKAGRLIATTDAEGVVVETVYDAVNRVLSRTVDPTGLALTTSYMYDAKGQVIETTDPEGAITRTHYDNKGQVTAVIIDARPVNDTSHDNQYLSLTTFYSYDSRGNRLTEMVGGNNTWIDGLDETGNPGRVFNQALNVTRYVYDIHGRLQSKVIDPSHVTADSESSNSYNHVGLDITRSYEYDAAGNLIAETNPRGYTTRYIYDRFNRLVYTVAGIEDNHGIVTEYRYDGAGNRVAQVSYANTIDLTGIGAAPELSDIQVLVSAVASVQDDRVQQMVYDDDGRLVYTINPAGIVSKNIYDANDNIIQIVSYSQAVPFITSGNAVSYTSLAQLESALVVQSQTDRPAWSVYDNLGRALYNVDSLGHVTENVYDGNGRLLRTVQYAQAIDTGSNGPLSDPATARAEIALVLQADADADRVCRYVYDAAGRLVYKVDAEGYITEMRYDDAGRAVEHIAYADRYTGLPATPSLSEVSAALPVQPGAEDRVILTIYDAAGRIIASSDATEAAESYEYDAAGNRTARTAANGARWTYRYDAANRMIEEISPVVAVTRLDAAIVEQDFNDGTLGSLEEYDPVGNAFTVSAGRLEVRTQENATSVAPALNAEEGEIREYEFVDRMRFQAQLTLGESDLNQQYIFFGAHNHEDGSARRTHGLLLKDGVFYAAYDSGSGQTLQALSLQPQTDTTYVVEVTTHTGGTTLYVYEKGMDRSTGSQHALSHTDWGNASVRIYTRAGSGQGGGLVYLDNLRELLPENLERLEEAARLTDITEYESIIRRIEYNAMGDVSRIIEAAGTPEERQTIYNYDPLNRQVLTTHPEVGVYDYADESMDYASGRQETPQSPVEATYYDTFGNAVAGVDAAGNVSYRVYDRANRLQYEVDANGYVTERVYQNGFGEAQQLIRYANAVTLNPSDISQGLSLTEVEQALDPDSNLDRALTTAYDKLGRATQVEQAAVTVATLNTAGEPSLSQASPTVTKEYDAFGQLIKQSTLAAGGSSLDIHFYYDQKGNRIGQLDPGRYLTVWEYDLTGNVTRQVEYAQSLGNPTAIGNEYNPADYGAVSSKALSQSRSLNSEAPDQLGYPLQTSSSVGAFIEGYITGATDIAAVDYIEARLFQAGTTQQVGQTALTDPSAISGYDGEVYLSEHALLDNGRYDIQITVYWNDGRAASTNLNLDPEGLSDVVQQNLPEHELDLEATGVETTETVDAHVDHYPRSGGTSYLVQTGDTWASVATALYGDAGAADLLEAHYGFQELTVNGLLQNLPVELTRVIPLTEEHTYERIPTNPDYEIQSGDTWASIAAALYGDATVAAQLSAYYNNITLVASEMLEDLPAELVDSEEVVIQSDPYYIVQSGDTWASIATALYGSANVADDLQAHYAGIELAEDLRLSGLPESLSDRSWHVLNTGYDLDSGYTDPDYEIQSGDTWASIATALYNNAAAADELEAHYNSQQLIADDILLDLPEYLADSDKMITVQSGDTWASLAAAWYGSADLAAELKTALNHPALTVSTQIGPLPQMLVETGLEMSAPYYNVQHGDTWDSLALKFYGTTAAATPLRVALSNPALLAGEQLTLPSSLSYVAETDALAGYEVGMQLSSGANAPLSDDTLIGFDRETRYTYDGMNRQLTETRVGVIASERAANVSDTENHSSFSRHVVNVTIAREYDAVGNLILESTTSEREEASETIIRDYGTTRRFYDAMGRLLGQTEVSRTQLRYGIETSTVVYADVAENRLRWARPEIPGMEVEVEVRAVGTSGWTTLIDQEGQEWLTASTSGLANGQYEYKIEYTRANESEVYATANGQINIYTGTSTGSVNMAYKVTNNGDTLVIAGATTGLTNVTINGTDYDADPQGNGVYHVNLSTLPRGTYNFITEGGSTELAGQVQKLTGGNGSTFSIQTLDVGVTYEILSKVKYEFDSHDPRYWGNNRIRINIPEFSYLGNEPLNFQVTLEFKNVHGGTGTRTFSGTVTGTTIIIGTENSDITSHDENTQAKVILDGLVDIKLWRAEPSMAVIISKLKGNTVESGGGDFKKHELLFDADGSMHNQRLEFVNLPQNTTSAVFAYRPAGSDEAFIFRSLQRMDNNLFVTGNRDIPAGKYEYYITLNGKDHKVEANAYRSGTVVLGSGVDSPSNVGVSTAQSVVPPPVNLMPLTTYRHDVFGNVVKTTEHANSAVRNADGSYVAQSHASDRHTYSIYSAFGKPLQVQDAEGNGVFFSYDIRGNLAKQWLWSNTELVGGVAGERIFNGQVYRYDAVGQMVESIEVGESRSYLEGSGIWEAPDYLPIRTELEYNAFGEVVLKTNHGYSGTGDDRVEFFDYDRAGRLWRSNAEDGVAKIFLYDVQGNRVQTLASQSTNLGTAAYDSTAELNAAIVASGLRRHTQKYDDNGRVTFEWLPGRVQDSETYAPEIERTLDRWGNAIREVVNDVAAERHYDQGGNVIRQVEAADDGVAMVDENTVVTADFRPTTDIYFDALGRQIGTIDAAGNSRAQLHDEAGQVVEQIAGDGGVRRYVYDIFGQQIERIQYRGAAGVDGVSMLYLYDKNGRLDSEYMSGGGETRYRYDEAGNRITVSRLANIETNGDRRYEITRYRYDNRGRVIEELRNVEIEHYDDEGMLLDSDINSTAIAIRYGYDAYGNKSFEQQYPDNSVEATWQYDGFGRLTDQGIGHVDFGGGNYSYSYNAAGQLLTESVSRSGDTETKTYVYYADGRLQSLTHDRVGLDTLIDRYEYDINGRITREAGEKGSLGLYENVYEYDDLGRLTHVLADTDNNSLIGPYGGYYLNLNYQYDAVGNIRHVSGTKGQHSGYTDYITNELGQLVGSVGVAAEKDMAPVNMWYIYDGENRVTLSGLELEPDAIKLYKGYLDYQGNINNDPKWVGNEGSMAVTYDKAGNRIQAQYYRNGKKITETQLYNASGRLAETTEGVGNSTSQREYDMLGRLVKYTSYRKPGEIDTVERSQYDDNGLLMWQRTFEIGSGGSESLVSNVSYAYDSSGNMLRYHVFVSGTNGYWQDFEYEYRWFESAQIKKISGSGQNFVSETSTKDYDLFGNRLGVQLNAAGQALGSGGKYFYYHAGKPITEMHLMQLSETGAVGAGPGSYIVRAGDTLQSIALASYGDAQLWYVIADANGLVGTAELVTGQSLSIPDARSVRNAGDTYRPLDPNEIYDNSLHLNRVIPKPVDDKSNIFVAIVAFIVQIIVTVYTMNPTLGNLAGQAINVIGGNQEEINWTSVAISFFSQGFAGAMGDAYSWSATTTQLVGNVLNQGMSIAMGQQEKFSWASLATSAINAQISGAAGSMNPVTTISTSLIGARLNEIETGKDADWGAVMLDAFGQAIANSLMADRKVEDYKNNKIKRETYNAAGGDKNKYKAIDVTDDVISMVASMGVDIRKFDDGGLKSEAAKNASKGAVSNQAAQQQIESNDLLDANDTAVIAGGKAKIVEPKAESEVVIPMAGYTIDEKAIRLENGKSELWNEIHELQGKTENGRSNVDGTYVAVGDHALVMLSWAVKGLKGGDQFLYEFTDLDTNQDPGTTTLIRLALENKDYEFTSLNEDLAYLAGKLPATSNLELVNQGDRAILFTKGALIALDGTMAQLRHNGNGYSAIGAPVNGPLTVMYDDDQTVNNLGRSGPVEGGVGFFVDPSIVNPIKGAVWLVDWWKNQVDAYSHFEAANALYSMGAIDSNRRDSILNIIQHNSIIGNVGAAGDIILENVPAPKIASKLWDGAEYGLTAHEDPFNPGVRLPEFLKNSQPKLSPWLPQ